MGESAPATAAGGVHGFPAALTSFVGRAGAVREVAGLLEEYRLVTVTGPGGSGKTRLAGEVAGRVAGRFADGVWLAELAAVADPALVAAAVAAALGVRDLPGVPAAEALGQMLARQQLLLVLDNCEHLLAGVAQLCGSLLPSADDVRVLATSREPIGVGGEARYRLGPLGLPGLGDLGGIGGSEAVTLFADRARQADAHFALDRESGPVVARIVARLDGMPLAIELAAARAEALGVAQLLDRLDDRFTVLAGGDVLAPSRQRSLAAAVQWSYQLLAGDERRVFRLVSVIPGPFTLQAAEAMAGPGAGQAVLHLVDCSLLVPPRVGPDGRARYVMLETLRAFGLERLAEAGEQAGAAAALAAYALQVAQQAEAGLRTSTGELAAARWLDAEDATVHQALTWAVDHDPAAAVGLAVALAPWWYLRGRWAAGRALLRRATEYAAAGGQEWCAGQLWLGHLAAAGGADSAALGHFTLAGDALAARAASPMLADVLAGRSAALRNLGRLAEAAGHARRALAIASELGYSAGRAAALIQLGALERYREEWEASLDWLRQAQQVDPASIPGRLARPRDTLLAIVLAAVGQVAAAQRSSADGLAWARQAGDLSGQAFWLIMLGYMDQTAGRIPQAGAHLREVLQIAARTGDRRRLVECLDLGGHICAATGRHAEAITLWAASGARRQDYGMPDLPDFVRRREGPSRKAANALGAARTRAAGERGAAMTLQAAGEYAALLATPGPPQPPESPGLHQLSARERELVTLVAQGCTDTQIAAQLYISIRTVRSHLDRIRDKTGCRRRADLTRLALSTGLV